MAHRRPAALAWFDTARLVGIALYLPTLALAEVRAVRPDAAPLLIAANVFDALAAHVVYIARRRTAGLRSQRIPAACTAWARAGRCSHGLV